MYSYIRLFYLLVLYWLVNLSMVPTRHWLMGCVYLGDSFSSAAKSFQKTTCALIALLKYNKNMFNADVLICSRIVVGFWL